MIPKSTAWERLVAAFGLTPKKPGESLLWDLAGTLAWSLLTTRQMLLLAGLAARLPKRKAKVP